MLGEGPDGSRLRRRSGTYFLRSFGCQMNEHDAERIAGLLEESGLARVGEPDEADILVYNTCSIREKADNRLAGHLSLATRLKREEPERVVVVAGCLAQSRREAFFADFPCVDVLVGPQSLHLLPALLDERLDTGDRSTAFAEKTTRWSADLPRSRVSGPGAWVQVVAGCSNFCSYCIVPYVRGPEASRPVEAIMREVADLAAAGVRQVTFLGQNVNAYGKEPGFVGDLGAGESVGAGVPGAGESAAAGGDGFVRLLRRACSVPGVERLRFMTSHPKDMSEELIDVLGEQNQVCEHLHLPAQSGSDRVLSAMRRGYDRAGYLALVRRLRDVVPGLALTTDLIVGFPGETEDDFAATLSLVEECRFDGAFTFVYSPRRDTEAASLPWRVDEAVAQERMQRLVAAVQRIAHERNSALVGQTVEVMVERPSRQHPGEVMGRTRGHKPVNFSCAARPGDLVTVELLEATSTSFRGRLAP